MEVCLENHLEIYAILILYLALNGIKWSIPLKNKQLVMLDMAIQCAFMGLSS